MPNKITVFIFASLFSFSLLPGIFAQAADYDKYLTIADIEKSAGLTGIQQVPREPRKGAGGHLNFADQKGNLVLLASFLTAADFNDYKNQESMIKATLSGLGDEAFIGPAIDTPYMLMIRKGEKCIGLSTFPILDQPGQNRLTMEQMMAIGKVVIGRI